MKIAFTCDIDWASELVIKDTLDLFQEYKIKSTLFCTHKSIQIDKCDRNLFEIGIHPNFNKNIIEGNGEKGFEIVKKLKDIYPEAIGVRSHSITTSGPILEIFKQNNLLYECNQFIPYSKTINPYKCWNGMSIIQYNFEDDVHFTYNNSFDFSLIDEFSSSKYLIMDFHPIHIYLNTDSEKTYQNAKPYFNSSSLKKYKNTKEYGVRDLLIQTFKQVMNKRYQTYHLKNFIL